MQIPIEDMIEQAFKSLMTYQEEGELPPTNSISFPHELIIRGSTRELVQH